MNADHNDPAFPQTAGYGNSFTGMSLRDYFAAKAMVSMHAHPAHERPDGIAAWAYSVADAMLVERGKP